MPKPNEKDEDIALHLVEVVFATGNLTNVHDAVEEKLAELRAEKEKAVKQAEDRGYNKGYSTAYNDGMRNSSNTVKQAEQRVYVNCEGIAKGMANSLYGLCAEANGALRVVEAIKKAADKAAGRE